MWMRPKYTWKWALAATVVALGVILGSILWKASRALESAHEEQEAENVISFSSVQLKPSYPSSVDWVSSAAGWSDATIFRGHVYLAGPTGLLELDPEGKTLARYRVGLELP